MTEHEWELLKAIYFRRTLSYVDSRDKDWKRQLAEYDNLQALGYASYVMTGPGDGVYQFTITEAGRDALREHGID